MYTKILRYSFLIYLLCGGYVLSATLYYKQLAVLPFVVPLLYFALTFVVALLLHRKLGERLHAALILFLLAVATAYVSFVPATFGDSFAFLLYHTASLLSVSFLVHFLKYYFALLGISWPYIKSLRFYYSFPVLAFVCSVGAILVPAVTTIVQWVTILLFTNGLFNVFTILLIGYKRSYAAQLKWLIGLCIIPFLPFVIGYILPTLLSAKPLLRAEIAALFFSIIPVGFIVFQVGERLFGLDRYVSRLRYISLLTATTSVGLAAIFWVITFDLRSSLLFMVVAIVGIASLLLVKERLDLRQRKTAPHARLDEQAIFVALRNVPTRQQLLFQLPTLVKKYLDIQFVNILEENAIVHELTFERGVYRIGIERGLTLQIGDKARAVQLLREEMQFLELLTPFVEVLLQQFKVAEDIASDSSNATIEKLAWQLVEREKRNVAQQLHDTILQEQLQLARQLDEDNTIREQLLDINYELREFCETLHPPLLEAIGLEAALNKLVQKTKLRADFSLSFSVQLTNMTDDALSLMLYRTVQELLANAMKHAQASKVVIDLTVFDGFYTLHYEDDGVGFTDVDGSSFGLSGMEQRSKIFGGVMRKITSSGTTFIFSNRKEHIDAYNRSR